MGVIIYGASDDLIEIEGDIREEFNPGTDAEGWLAVSNGTLLRVRYDRPGVWTFRLWSAGRGNVVVEPAGPDYEENYSDRVVIDTAEHDPVTWVLYGEQFARDEAADNESPGGGG